MFGRNVIIGQYIPLDSAVHRLDPRSKLLVVALGIVTLFLVQSWISFLFLAAFCGILAAVARLSFRYFLKSLRPLWILLLLTLVLHVFFTQDGVVLFGFLRVSFEGFIKGLFIVVRLALLVVVTTILTLTTSPIELTDGMEGLLSPLKKWGFPAHELAMMMTIALRFIPTLLEEADRIMKAQMARGVDFESGGLLNRIRGLVPLLVPLFVSAFRRAEDLAIAMESRCYRGGVGRTRLKVLRFAPRDYLFLCSAFSTFVLSLGIPWIVR
ncbi:MAG: energy-coupling factor transporter transmembrane protein EcfT [Atribacterota bacterium]